MSTVLMAVGFVLVFEGLVFALFPNRLEDLVEAISRLTIDNRRIFGLVAVGCGVLLLWVAKSLGA
ncbi:MAG: DUF2065 domain-containing protein [Pseudomonadota bacterium]